MHEGFCFSQMGQVRNGRGLACGDELPEGAVGGLIHHQGLCRGVVAPDLVQYLEAVYVQVSPVDDVGACEPGQVLQETGAIGVAPDGEGAGHGGQGEEGHLVFGDDYAPGP